MTNPKSIIFYFLLPLLLLCCNNDEPLPPSFNRSNPDCLVSKIKYLQNELQLKPILEKTYHYNSEDQISKIIYLLGSIENGIYTDTFSNGYRYFYDSLNRPIMRTTLNKTSFFNLDTIIYEYLNESIMVSKLSGDDKYQIKEIEYDDDLLPIAIYIPRKDENKTEFTYLNGNIINETSIGYTIEYSYFDRINPLAYSSLFTLNPVSNYLVKSFEKSTYISSSDTTFNTSGIYKYEYNSFGYPTKMTKTYTHVTIPQSVYPNLIQGYPPAEVIYDTIIIEYEYIYK